MRIRVFLVFLLPLLFLLLLIWMIVRFVRRRKRLIYADSVAEGTVTDVRSKPVSKKIYQFTAYLDYDAGIKHVLCGFFIKVVANFAVVSYNRHCFHDHCNSAAQIAANK